MLFAMGLGLAVLALLLVRTLAQSRLPRTATNDLPAVAELRLPPSATRCQTEELVPRGTGSVSIPVRSDGAAAGRVRVILGRSTGTAAAPRGRGFAFVRLAPVLRADLRAAEVCFENTGPSALALIGAAPSGGHPVRVRLDWFRPHAQRNLTMGSTVAARFALQKAPFLGPWALWLAAALVAALSAAALVWLTRGVRE